MGSVLQNTQLNKVFLIYGNLDDMFISHNLQKDNFRFFLNSHLKNLGYEQVVFYSGAKNVGKFVLDDESAILAINKNKGCKLENTAGKAPAQPEKKRRIMNPAAKKKAIQDEKTEKKSENVDKPADKTDESTKVKLVYSQPKITPVEFLEDAKKIMADNSHKSAIVFTFFQDFFTDSSAPLQPYYELVSYLWDEYHSMNNDNICIFLAPQMTNCDLNEMFNKLEHGTVLKNRFFNQNGTTNPGTAIEIGLPGLDEIGYMLEYLRIVGDGGRRITFKQKDKKRLCSVLMYLTREAETKEHKSGYLHAIYNTIVEYMKNKGESVAITEDILKQLYGKYRKIVSSDPLEKLHNTKGWESVAKRVDEILKDYRRKKKQAAVKQNFNNDNSNIKTNERLENSDYDSSYKYPIPHFILKGNPGVGKTTIARLIGQIFYDEGILERGNTIETNRAGLVGQYVGETAIKTTEIVRSATEGVLFIDDAYSLIDNRDSNSYAKEAIDTLVPILTNGEEYRFCLIMAGYPNKMDDLLDMNPGLRSRFSKANIITIEDYNPDLLKTIFINECQKDGYTFIKELALNLDLFFENLYSQRDRENFGNARDIVALADEVKLQCGLRDEVNKIIIQEDFADSQKYFIKRGVSSIEEIYEKIDKYVGMDFVKRLFRKVHLEMLDRQDCIERGIKPEDYPDHFIFSGNPGTGKTTVGKMLGEFYHMLGVFGGTETLLVDAEDLIGTHVGEAQQKTSEIIQKAINQNKILFIDEAYRIQESAYCDEVIGAMIGRMTENAKDLKIVFAMYPNKVEGFLKMNSGLASRLRVVEFPDYTPLQLLEIFDRTIAANGCTIADDARERIKLILTHMYNVRTEDFGNAREVKKVVSAMKECRLYRNYMSSNKGVDKYQYILDDIPNEMLDMVENMVNARSIESIMKELDEQIGMSDLKNIVISKQEEIMYAKRSKEALDDIRPGYYFFVGNPGTGKSTSAKLFAECLNQLGVVKTNKFYSCTAKDLIGEYVGQTQPKSAALLQKSINGVLFIDEAYSLSCDDGHNGTSFKKEAVEELIAFMDIPEHRKDCCIILAGYEKDMQGLYRSNSGMRSRIEEVHFNDYSADECYKIFELFCHKNGFKLAEGIKETYIPMFEHLKKSEYFANGRTARTIFEKTISRLKRRIARANTIDELDVKQILPEDLLTIDEAMKIVGVDGK